MTTRIRLANFDEYPEIAIFIDQNWKRNHVYIRSKALFDWTFQNTPSWTESNYSVSIATSASTIVGMLGVIPFHLNIYGKSCKACWLVNWLLIPEARKGRTGLDLLTLFSKTLAYDTISFGINDTVARLYDALKWQHMPSMPRLEWVDPIRASEVEEFLVEANPTATIDQIHQYVRRHGVVIPTEPSLRSTRLDSVEPTAWNNHGWFYWRDKTIDCTRDFDYLNWRYLRHPIYRYETRVIADDQRLGLIVWRLETSRKVLSTGQTVDYMPFARIVEFLPVSERNANDLVATFLNDAIAAGAIAADFYCYNSELVNILRQMGFSVTADRTEVSLPNHTQPVGRGGDIRSAIKIVSNEQLSSRNPDWYWTRSDSDQDRPN